MKYEKLADSLVSLIHGNDYQYRMYKGSDGKRTSNPYDARYFFVTDPNMMFIIDEDDNSLTVHKSNIPFNLFKPLHKTLRNLTRRYFVNLEVKDYNGTFTPKDFSPTLLRKNYKLNHIKTESYHHSKIKESYESGKNTLDVFENGDSITLSLNGTEGFSLPIGVNELVPFIVENSLKNGSIDRGFIRRLYTAYEKYTQLYKQSSQRKMTESEEKFIKSYSKFFSS